MISATFTEPRLDDTEQRLLYKIASAVSKLPSGGNCGGQSGSGSPVGIKTPAFVDQLYHDTTADAYYRSTGLTSADWTAIGGGVCTGLVWTPATPTDAIELDLTQLGGAITSLSFPGLVSTGDFMVAAPPGVLTISADDLVSVTAGDFQVNFNASLTTLSLLSLVSVSGSLFTNGLGALTTVLVPNWVPTDGSTINFNSDALDATSVELILRRCVLAGVATCTIDLSGGTNAGLASLSAQGQSDAAALGAQLTINP